MIYICVKKIGESFTLSSKNNFLKDYILIIEASPTSDKYIKKLNVSELESLKKILEPLASENNDKYFIVFGVKIYKQCRTISASKMLVIIGYLNKH